MNLEQFHLMPGKLIVKIDPEPRDKNGILIPISIKKKKNRGEVVKTGADCTVKVGDRVIFPIVPLPEFEIEGTLYRIIEEKRMLCYNEPLQP